MLNAHAFGAPICDCAFAHAFGLGRAFDALSAIFYPPHDVNVVFNLVGVNLMETFLTRGKRPDINGAALACAFNARHHDSEVS